MLNTIDRVRREVERNALRARNGIRMATGIQRTDAGGYCTGITLPVEGGLIAT